MKSSIKYLINRRAIKKGSVLEIFKKYLQCHEIASFFFAIPAHRPVWIDYFLAFECNVPRRGPPML